MQFRVGSISNYIDNWNKITNNNIILDIVEGCHIEFDAEPIQPDTCILMGEINKLLQKEVVIRTSACADQFLSTISTRPKQDNTVRLILNLKKLNTFVSFHHFKMET